MPPIKHDTMLKFTRLLLRAVQFIAIFGAVMIALITPALWAKRSAVLAALAEQGGKTYGTDSMVAITVIMLACLIMLALALRFISRLLAIIGSLQDGSPFVPANAARLREMGWIVVLAQVIALLFVPIGAWVGDQLPDHDVDFSVSLEGLLTALLLFILAQVFDHGTALTEDAEGTV